MATFNLGNSEYNSVLRGTGTLTINKATPVVSKVVDVAGLRQRQCHRAWLSLSL